MKVEITIPNDAKVGTAVSGQVTDTGAGSGPPPPPSGGGKPMAETPADGTTHSFHGFPANQWVSTKAGGDGKFSAAVPSGNAAWKVRVNGKLTIDGAMDYSPVKKGDTIEWMMTTPAYQDDCTYTISLP